MRRLAYIALASALLASSLLAGSQKPSGAETGLLGVHLYDSSVKVITMFGSPNAVEAVTIGGSGGGGGGGGAAGAAPGGGPGRPGGGPSSGSTAGPVPGHIDRPGDFDDFGDSLLQTTHGVGSAPKTGNPLAKGGNGGLGNGAAPGSNNGGNASNNGNATANSQEVKFLRWIYNRSGCKYGFVIDNFGRVVQIEAIGMGNAKVHTARGIRFGSTFGQIIKRYNTKNSEGGMNSPDGYEVSGDTLTVRYLVKNKVAFRLNRLAKDGPQVVTAIAVSAGKQ